VSESKYLHISDQELLDQFARTGDNHWLGVLLERHTLLLYGVCVKHLKNADLAKDMVQQVHLKAIEEVGKYDIAYFKSWLYMIAINFCNMHLRQRKRLFRDIHELDYERINRPGQGVNEMEDQQLGAIPEALDELKMDQQVCVKMFYLEDKSYLQIAAATKYSLNQIKSNIQNGKRNLKMILERKVPGEKEDE
jgi:RNA polymerase sigma factor (sigma-70 family)